MQTWQGLFFWKIFCWFCHFCAHMKVKEKLYNQNILFRFYYYIKLSYRKLASFLWLSIVPNKSIKKMSTIHISQWSKNASKFVIYIWVTKKLYIVFSFCATLSSFVLINALVYLDMEIRAFINYEKKKYYSKDIYGKFWRLKCYLSIILHYLKFLDHWSIYRKSQGWFLV